MRQLAEGERDANRTDYQRARDREQEETRQQRQREGHEKSTQQAKDILRPYKGTRSKVALQSALRSLSTPGRDLTVLKGNQLIHALHAITLYDPDQQHKALATEALRHVDPDEHIGKRLTFAVPTGERRRVRLSG